MIGAGAPIGHAGHLIDVHHAIPNKRAVGERICHKLGQDISLRLTTEPDVKMYEFLKDYLEFRIVGMKKQSQTE